MKKPWTDRFGDFMAGKGFYIVLFLCVAAIGISGYYLFSTLGGNDPAATVGGTAQVTVTPSPSVSPSPRVDAVKPTIPATPKPTPTPTPTPTPSASTAPSATPKPSEVVTSSVYTWPVKGAVLNAFSLEQQVFNPTMGDWRTHEGVDIAADLGIQVKAAAGGTVTAIEQDYFMGTTVTIDHGNGMVSVYSNLAEQPTVEVGDVVTTGDIIGSVGSTAKAESLTASHLHLEMMKDGAYVDPLEYLPDVK